MKIVEIAIITDQTETAGAFLAPAFSRKENVLGLDVYRWEVSEDLVVLLYHIPSGNEVPEELSAHLQPHIRGLILLLSDPANVLEDAIRSTMDGLTEKFADKPVVVSVFLPMEQMNALPALVRDCGFYLTNKGRILFWNTELPESRKRVFQTLLDHLRQPMPRSI